MPAFRTLPILLLVAALTVFAGCDDDNLTPPPTATPAATATSTSAIPTTATAVPATATAIPPTATVPPSTPTASIPPTATATTVPTSTETSTPEPTETAEPTATASATATPTITASPTPATPTPTFTDRQLLESVPSAETWSFSGLEDEVQVLRTEGNVPHIYASNRRDLSYVHGFLLARDRYFMMDLTRRLGRGRTSELIGDSALDVDIESRMTGLTHVADRLADNLTAEQRVLADAFAAGVNEYIALAAARQVPLPSELRLAGPLLGASNPATLMVPFTYRDVASILAVIMYQSSYETGDVGRDATYANIGEPFAGDPFEELRMAGLLQDVAPSIDPVYPISSGAGFGLETGDTFLPGPLPEDVPGAIANGTPVARRARRSGPSGDLLASLAEKLEAFESRLGRFEGFGSNSWAVSGTKTNSGASLLAGDGHLGLDVPPIFYQIGLDTSLLGGGDVHQIGLTIPGFLVMPVGTNGNVAWCQTQLSADATDWYAEEIRLDANGLPEASLFQGEWEPLQRVDETFEIANVPALDSVGRTEVWPRFKTFDGRFLTAIEGRRVAADAEVGEGESVVMTLSGFVVPRDENADGIVSAVTFDFTGLDVGSLLSSTDGFGLAADVEEFRQSARGLVGYSQNIIAADKDGGILYTSKDAVPCRGYLPRNPDGSWVDRADPRRVLDGTIYPGFEIPLTDGVVDEDASGGDPRRCIVPFDSTPQSLRPSRGYVLTANNDPGNIALDSSLENDPWYIGGPWNDGFRAETIDRRLAELTASGDADVDEMARLQGNHESRLGELFGPRLIEAIQTGRMLTMVDRILTPDEDRLAALYAAESTALDEIEQRLSDWAAGGYEAESGVETFYHVVAPGEPENAVATMIFNAWIGRFLRGVWNDEGFNGGFFERGDLTRIKLLNEFLEARDAGEASGLASFNAETGESIFFDVRGTEPVERSREIMLAAMRDALAFLRSPQESPGNGGFGTDDMSQWIWGLRHQVKFESLLAPFLGNDPTFEVFTRPFNIDTNKLPLAPNLPTDDPRFGLRWFPRPGDQWGVDAANPGFSGTNFTHGSGPVMRMVFALKDGEVSGLNVIPGGQSGLTDSPYFTDQAALWLANEAYPIRFSIGDVVAGATKREVYRPTGCTSAESCEEFEYCQDPIGSNALSSCGICCVTSEADACGLTLCDTDDDCSEAGDVCQPTEPVDCLCEQVTVCRPGCAAEADCHPGETCDPDGHCVETSCTSDGDCPAEFLCNGNSVCERRTCTGSGECGGGACVNGACYSEPGTCEPFGV